MDALKKKWQPNYKNVDEIIQKLKKRDCDWYNLSLISSANRHILMDYIKKDN